MASRFLRPVLIGASILLLYSPVLAEDADEEPDPVILGIVLVDAPMTLEKGMAASEPHGKPISAKFENADGDVRLSVYTVTASGFVESVLNPKTGVIVSAGPITDTDDLVQAGAQKAAMEKATVSLQTATAKAVSENPDSKAVSAIPALQDGQATATVKLLHSNSFTTVTEKLN
jgi:hypothetical protein